MKALVKAMLSYAGVEVRRVPRPVSVSRATGLREYNTKLGTVFLPAHAPRDWIAAHMRRGEIFEPEVVAIARRFIKTGTTVLDLGANFGQMSMLFADMVGPAGHVYSFEAQRQVYEILCRNLRANHRDNVAAEFKAVFNASSRMFNFPEPDFSRFLTLGSFNLPLDAKLGDPVESVRIDDYTFDQPISFMKIDVQGCDLFAMQGAVETIKQHQMPILFEFEQDFQEEYRTSFQDYVDFTASIEYKFVETVLKINYLIVPKSGRGPSPA